MTAVEKKPRYAYLDVLKIVAMFCVVFYHSAGSFLVGLDCNLSNEILTYICGIFSASVPIFFMVNGALLFNKGLDKKKHVRKTIKTFVFVFIWSFILFACKMPIKQEQITFSDYIIGSITLKVGWTNHLWFLLQLSILYLFFPLLKRLFDKNKKSFFLLFFLFFVFTTGVSFLNSLIMSFSHLTNLSNFSQNFNSFSLAYYKTYGEFIVRCFFSFAYFMLGGLLQFYAPKIKERLSRNKIFVNIALLLAVFFFSICYYWYVKQANVQDSFFNGYPNIFVFLNATIIFVISLLNCGGGSEHNFTKPLKKLYGNLSDSLCGD